MNKRKKLNLVILFSIITSCSDLNVPKIENTDFSRVVNSTPTALTLNTSASPSSTISTITFTGVINDKGTSDAIENITVEFNGQETKTDKDGKFEFKNVKSGKSKIYFTKPGQYNDTRDVEIEDFSKSIHFILDINPVPLLRNSPTPGNVIVKTTTAPTSLVLENDTIEIIGTIKDVVTDYPITNALVRVGSINTLTDSAGFFKLKIKRGKDALIIIKDGYYASSSDLSFQSNESFLVSLQPVEIPINLTPTPTSTPTPRVTPIPTPTPTIVPSISPTPTPIPTILPSSTFTSRDGLIGIWEFTFTLKNSSSSRKEIIAFRNSPNSGSVFYAASILEKDKEDALNGRVDYHYLTEIEYNDFKYKGAWDSKDKAFYMLYTYYRSPVLQTGEYLSNISPLIALDKDTLIGTEKTINDDALGGEYSIQAKRLRDNFSLIGSNGEIFASYVAKFN